MADDDDWFERALTDEDAEAGESGGSPAGEDGTEAAEAADPEAAEAADPEAAEAEAPDGDGGSGGATDDEGATEGGADGDSTGDDAADPTDGDHPDDGAPGSEGEGQLFDQDFASELRSADQPDGEADGPFAGGDEGGFDGGGAFAGGDDEGFGGGGGAFAGEGDGLAGGGAGGDEFGMGGMGVGGEGATEFEAEAVDSDIDRIDLGVAGLDDMIRGGVPDSSLMAAIGSAGTGKTTLGLQFIQHGLANDERAIYITLEESKERVIRSAEEKGWPFREYIDEGRLAIVDMDPIEMANSLSSIRSELPRLVDRFGANRLVLDSVSLLEMMYDDRATRRNEIYTFARSLKEAGVTIMLTSEADEDNPYASRHGIVEYLTDAVYILQYVRPSDFRETRLAVEILKIRDAHHSREMKPYEITDDGLSVYRQANIF